MKRPAELLAVVGVLIATLTLVVPRGAWGQSGIPIEYTTPACRVPIAYYGNWPGAFEVEPLLLDAFLDASRVAASEWNDRFQLPFYGLNVEYGFDGNAQPTLDRGDVSVYANGHDVDGEVGAAFRWVPDGKNLNSSIVWLNYEDYQFWLGAASIVHSPWRAEQMDCRTTYRHELGHALGLVPVGSLHPVSGIMAGQRLGEEEFIEGDAAQDVMSFRYAHDQFAAYEYERCSRTLTVSIGATARARVSEVCMHLEPYGSKGFDFVEVVNVSDQALSMAG